MTYACGNSPAVGDVVEWLYDRACVHTVTGVLASGHVELDYQYQRRMRADKCRLLHRAATPEATKGTP